MDCMQNHSLCKAAQRHSLHSKRLLHFETKGPGNFKVRLIDAQAGRPPTGPYVALSHCWGGDESKVLRCLRSNLREFMAGIEYSSLPRVFQDCLTAAAQLGVFYVWIDSLCIIQDDRDDWAYHAGQLRFIYQQALAVIAATSSPNVSVPFLGPDAPTRRGDITSHRINIMPDMGSQTFVHARTVGRSPDLFDISGPLASRARRRRPAR
jgi:hypothetical protein